MKVSPVSYVNVSFVDSGFFVEHNEPLEASARERQEVNLKGGKPKPYLLT
jgi:hypothetical protein